MGFRDKVQGYDPNKGASGVGFRVKDLGVSSLGTLS